MAELQPDNAYAPDRFSDPSKRVEFSPEMMERLRTTLDRYPTKMAALLPALHLAQEQWGWVSPEAMEYIGGLLDLSPAYVYGVVSFYHMYNRHPVGKYNLQVCTNLSCMLNGAYDIYDMFSERLGCAPHEISKDGRFTYVEVECLGSCDTAPVVQINNDYYENTNVDAMARLLDELK